GNAALCGRELPPEAVLAASGHIDACARALRTAGLPGTLAQLRVMAYLDLTQGLDPLARLTQAGTEAGNRDQDGQDGDEPDRDGGDPEGEGRDDHGAPEDDGHGGAGGGGPRPGGRRGPGGGRGKAPVKAVITLLVPAGTLLGWSSAPGEIAG